MEWRVLTQYWSVIGQKCLQSNLVFKWFLRDSWSPCLNHQEQKNRTRVRATRPTPRPAYHLLSVLSTAVQCGRREKEAASRTVNPRSLRAGEESTVCVQDDVSTGAMASLCVLRQRHHCGRHRERPRRRGDLHAHRWGQAISRWVAGTIIF